MHDTHIALVVVRGFISCPGTCCSDSMDVKWSAVVLRSCDYGYTKGVRVTRACDALDEAVMPYPNP